MFTCNALHILGKVIGPTVVVGITNFAGHLANPGG